MFFLAKDVTKHGKSGRVAHVHPWISPKATLVTLELGHGCGLHEPFEFWILEFV